MSQIIAVGVREHRSYLYNVAHETRNEEHHVYDYEIQRDRVCGLFNHWHPVTDICVGTWTPEQARSRVLRTALLFNGNVLANIERPKEEFIKMPTGTWLRIAWSEAHLPLRLVTGVFTVRLVTNAPLEQLMLNTFGTSEPLDSLLYAFKVKFNHSSQPETGFIRAADGTWTVAAYTMDMLWAESYYGPATYRRALNKK